MVRNALPTSPTGASVAVCTNRSKTRNTSRNFSWMAGRSPGPTEPTLPPKPYTKKATRLDDGMTDATYVDTFVAYAPQVDDFILPQSEDAEKAVVALVKY